MDARKNDFANDVVRIVRGLGELVFNVNNDEQLESVFGVNHEQLDSVIKKITFSLPDDVFDKGSRLTDEIKNICAREFIFFQVQEKWSSPQYQNDLTNFIQIFTRDIQQRIEAYNKNYKMTKMKEE